MPLRDRLTRLLDLSADVAGDLDLSSVACRVAETVPDVTDFQVASVTLRDGELCRRLAVVGIDDTRVGLETDYSEWLPMLQERFRIGSISYLVNVDEVPARRWAQQPDRHRLGDIGAPAGVWTENHALVLALKDSQGDIVGFLSVDAPRSGRVPDPETIELLELLAHQAQAVLVNASLYGVAERQRRAAETLREVVETVSSSLDLDEVIRRCCDAAISNSVGQRATVFLHDPDSGSFVAVTSRGIKDEEQWSRLRDLDPIPEAHLPKFRRALETDQPAFEEDLDAADLEAAERELFQRFHVKSVAAYPLVASERKVGVLSIDAAEEAVTFPPDERELMRQIARHAAMAIRQAHLHQEAREQAMRITRLHELTKAMTETFDFAVIFDQVCRAVRARSEVSTVSVFELDEAHVELLRGDFGDLPQGQLELPFRVVPVRGAMSDLIDRLREDGSVIIDDVDSWPDLRAVSLPQTRSLLFAGHVREDGPRIVLATSSVERRAFTRDDAAFLRGLVQATALALRNSRLYEETREAAERDSLTGLKNRRMFWSELSWQLTGASLEQPTALAIIDVDDYKRVNDEHGHAMGDKVLRHVADRLSRSVRQTDTAYRIGGDEFALVMPSTDREEAAQVLERAADAVGRSRLSVPVPSLSSGIAVAPADGVDGDTLFTAADTAMYAQKRRRKEPARDGDGDQTAQPRGSPQA